MKKLSEVQNTVIRLRKKYRKALNDKNSEDSIRLKHAIHALEYVLDIQKNPTTVDTD